MLYSWERHALTVDVMMEQLTSRMEINHDDSGHQTGIQVPDSFELSTMVTELCFRDEYFQTGHGNARGVVSNGGLPGGLYSWDVTSSQDTLVATGVTR
jgi:hypothetical protein